jgi:hypothetical protein
MHIPACNVIYAVYSQCKTSSFDSPMFIIRLKLAVIFSPVHRWRAITRWFLCI